MVTQPGGGNWKRIGSHTKETTKMVRGGNSPAEQPGSTAIPHGHQAGHQQAGQSAAPGKSPLGGHFTRFLKFRGEAYCHTHEGVFMLMPEAEPSIGYKLQPVSGNTKSITDGGEEITEEKAIHLIIRTIAKPG